MAFEQNPYAVKITLVADSSLTAASQFLFVAPSTAITGTPSATAITAITQRPIGVLQNQPKVYTNAAGGTQGYSEAEVTVSGVCKVQAGGNISVGSVIGVNATGQAVAIVAGTATTQYILGTALSAGVSGDIVTVAISCANSARAA